MSTAHRTDGTPLLTPSKRLAKVKPPHRVPHTVILCLHTPLFDWAAKRRRAKRSAGFFGRTITPRNKRGRVAVVGHIGVGAPVISVLAEEWAALGTTQIILIGMVASLSHGLTPGTRVMMIRACGDDGVSPAYGSRDTQHAASPSLTNQLDPTRTTQRVGSYTTSTPYRTTPDRLALARSQHASVLEMEAAALFAVCAATNTHAAAVGVVADRFTDSGWHPVDNMRRINRALRHAYRDTLTAL